MSYSFALPRLLLGCLKAYRNPLVASGSSAKRPKRCKCAWSTFCPPTGSIFQPRLAPSGLHSSSMALHFLMRSRNFVHSSSFISNGVLMWRIKRIRRLASRLKPVFSFYSPKYVVIYRLVAIKTMMIFWKILNWDKLPLQYFVLWSVVIGDGFNLSKVH